MRLRFFIMVLAVGGTGCLRAAQLKPTPPVPPTLSGDAVPKGTLASAQLREPLSTGKSRPGDRFTMELLDPLVDGEGREVVGRGALVEGVVRRANGSVAAGDEASLELSLVGVQSPGEGVLPLPAEVASAPFALDSGLGRGLAAGLVGAAAGAGAGLAFDRDHASTVLGASLVGAGVGAVLSYLFGPREASLPSGSVVTLRLTGDFRLDHPVATLSSPPPCRLPEKRPKEAVVGPVAP